MRNLTYDELQLIAGGPPQNPPQDRGEGPGEEEGHVDIGDALAQALADLAEAELKRLISTLPF